MISTLATVFGGCALIVWLSSIAVARDKAAGASHLTGKFLSPPVRWMQTVLIS
jgi:fimbrial protein